MCGHLQFYIFGATVRNSEEQFKSDVKVLAGTSNELQGIVGAPLEHWSRDRAAVSTDNRLKLPDGTFYYLDF